MSLNFPVKGRQGDKGDQGDQGDKGDKGDKGDTGDPGFFTSRCSVWRNGVQSIPTGTHTLMEFNTVVYDVDSEYDAVTNHRFTPIAAGHYHVTAQGWLGAVGNEKHSTITIWKNGVEVGRSAQDYTYNYLPGVVSKDVYLNGVGDYIEIKIRHNSGVNRDLVSGIAVSYLTVHQFA